MDVVPMVASEHFYALPGDAEWNLLAIWRYLKISLISCFPGGSDGKEAACIKKDKTSCTRINRGKKQKWTKKSQITE